MIENIFTLLMLILLQAVLGFDNLIYIESKGATEEITCSKELNSGQA